MWRCVSWWCGVTVDDVVGSHEVVARSRMKKTAGLVDERRDGCSWRDL
jgi:hypothetical protein